MSADKIISALGHVDESLIARAADYRPVKKPIAWSRYAAMAACLVLALGAGFWMGTSRPGTPASPAPAPAVLTGGDILRDQLHLPGNYSAVSLGATAQTGTVVENHMAVERILGYACAGTLQSGDVLPRTDSSEERGCWYLVFQRPDGTTTTLRLIEGGFVALDGPEAPCVRVPDAEFEAFMSILEAE